jgi:hypothetical protein
MRSWKREQKAADRPDGGKVPNMRSAIGVLLTVLPAALAAFPVAGCDEPSSPPGRPPQVVVARGIARATTIRRLDRSGETPLEPFELTAVFPRYELGYEDLLGGFLSGHVEEPEIALDTCGTPSPVLGARQPRPLPGKTAVDLLDAGNLTLDVDGTALPMPSRAFPDLLKVVDGVMYSAEERQGARFLPGATYSLRSSGSDAIGPFEVVIDAPEDLGEIKLDGSSAAEQAPTVRRGEDLLVTWEGGAWGDEVIAEFTWTNLGLPWSMICRMRDDGRFVVPGDRTRGLQDPMHGGDEELRLSRIRQVAFRAAGLSAGTFVFMVATAFPVSFEGPS